MNDIDTFISHFAMVIIAGSLPEMSTLRQRSKRFNYVNIMSMFYVNISQNSEPSVIGSSCAVVPGGEFKLRYEAQLELNDKLEEQTVWYLDEVEKTRDKVKRGKPHLRHYYSVRSSRLMGH